jgi:hypothetical protein
LISNYTTLNEKVIKKYLIDDDTREAIVKDINALFNSIDDFNAETINKEISYYIFKKYQKDHDINNTNLYRLLKLIITGDAEAPYIGNICEFLGQKETILRVKRANQLTKAKFVENTKLLEEKRESCLKLISGTNETNVVNI